MAVAPTMSPDAQADAARLLYGRYYPNVYRYALSQLHAAEDAEDAAQNTFLRAFAALQKGTLPENELAWLFKIAHNVCATSKLAWLRRRRVETPRDLTALRVEPSSPEIQRDELAGLEHALAAMPQRPREAFLLREVQGLSYAEIADQLGTSRSAVETLIFRARKMLAEKLEQPMQRLRQALGLGPLLNLARGVFDAAPAAVKAGGAIAVVAGATVAAAPHPAATRPAPARATTTKVAIAPATMSRPGPQRAARRRTAAPAAPPHPRAVQQPGVPPAPGPPQAASPQTPSATPTPTEAPDTAAAQPMPAPTAPPTAVPSTEPILTLPALPVDVPTLPVTISPLPPAPAVPLPEIPAVVSVTTPDLPSVPQLTVQISLP